MHILLSVILSFECHRAHHHLALKPVVLLLPYQADLLPVIAYLRGNRHLCIPPAWSTCIRAFCDHLASESLALVG